MNIKSYESVNNISFGMSEEEVIGIFDRPHDTRYNNANELEFWYDDLIVRFDNNGSGVREITTILHSNQTIQLNGQVFSVNEHFFQQLCNLDGNPYEHYGFIILFKLGITLSGFHDEYDEDKILTIFRFGDWDKYKDKMKVFKI